MKILDNKVLDGDLIHNLTTFLYALYDVTWATTYWYRECRFFIQQESTQSKVFRDRTKVEQSTSGQRKLVVRFSDPLRRKNYEPKIILQEFKKDSSKTQLSLNFRNEVGMDTKVLESENQISSKEVSSSYESPKVSSI